MLAALLRRDVDGQGQVVDTAMFEAVLRMTGDALAVRSALGIRRERAGGDSPIYPCSITVEAADRRFVAVSAESWDRRRHRARAPGPSAIRRSRARPPGAGGDRERAPRRGRDARAPPGGPRREPGELGGGSRGRGASLEPRRPRAVRRSRARPRRDAGRGASALGDAGADHGLVARARIRQRRGARGVAGLCAGPDSPRDRRPRPPISRERDPPHLRARIARPKATSHTETNEPHRDGG